MENLANDDIKKIAAFMLMTLAISNSSVANVACASPMDMNASMPGITPSASVNIPSVEFYAPMPGITPSASVDIPNVAFYAPMPGITPPASVQTPTVEIYAPMPGINPPASVQTPTVEIYAPLSNVETINVNTNSNTTYDRNNSAKDTREQLLPVNKQTKTQTRNQYGSVQVIDDGRQYIFE